MSKDNTAVNRDEGDTDRVTITEAATLLRVHPNTVRNRVKADIYNAEKVFTENGFTWMIDRDSLVNAPLSRDSQQVTTKHVNPDAVTPMEMVQDLLRPFVEDLGRVREELGAERVRREQAERERDELRAHLEALQALETPPDTPHGASPHPGTVGTQDGEQEQSANAERSVNVERHTEETARQPWWIRWFGG